jgi:MOSC domain-containing protein YiiM
MKLDRPQIIDRMLETGRTGWYLRVVRPGHVPVAGPIRIVERHPAGVSVLDAHRAAVPGGAGADELRRLLDLDPLAAGWRRAVARRLRAQQSGGA